MRRRIGLFLLFSLLAGSARAEEEWVHPDSSMGWYFVAWHQNVQVQLWSQNRPGVSWGPYSLPYNVPYPVTFSCKQDEYICFGA